MKRKRVGELNYFQILNLHSSATDELIGQAYLNLTSVYGVGSNAAYGALNENEKEWMLKRIQEAYDTLKEPDKRTEYISGLDDFDEVEEMAKQDEHADIKKRLELLNAGATNGKTKGENNGGKPNLANEAASPYGPLSSRITGEHLRNVRMARGSTLEEIAASTKINKSFLEALEMDNFDAFPAPVFMKGFLKSYANALGLNPEEICERYFFKE